MRIAVLGNMKENAPIWKGMSPDQWDDLDSPETVKAIIRALESAGHRSVFLEASIGEKHDLIGGLRDFRPDLCFNIAEGHFGDGREAHGPSILEMLGIPYTGSRVLTLALTLDKPMTKRILHYHELPTPEFQVFGRPDDSINEDLVDSYGKLLFPLFVKPSREGTGMGVSTDSIVHNVTDLRKRIRSMLGRYNQPVLCERFVRGREITLGIVGNLRPTAPRRLSDRTAPRHLPEELTLFPPLEVDFEKYDISEEGLYSNRLKTELVHEFHYHCPAKLNSSQTDELNRLAAAVFRVMGCCDVARVDFRLDESDGDKPYILEINPLPGLNPDYSDLPIECYAVGWTYEKLVNTIVEKAVSRLGIKRRNGRRENSTK